MYKKIIILFSCLSLFLLLFIGKSSADNISSLTAVHNFDWSYYCETNSLNLNTEYEAYEHYRTIGFFNNFAYCKPFNIALLLSVGDLQGLNNIIDQINYFMRINEANTYHLKISIPKGINQSETKNSNDIFKFIKTNVDIPEENIEIIFTESNNILANTFLLIDRLHKSDHSYDFVVNLYSASNKKNEEQTISFLNMPINKLLRLHECLISNQSAFDLDQIPKENKQAISHLLNHLKITNTNFSVPQSGMFIASVKFLDYLSQHNLLELYNIISTSNNTENLEKIVFGAILSHLQLDIENVGFHSKNYIYDNACPQVELLHNFPVDSIKEYIKRHNIKLMALYFPQFHEFEENNTFWGKGFTEWTLINKYAGEIKRPHIDIGQYNMLEYETRKKQALIAKEYGINSFCYYHYWFKDKKIMHQGIEKILEDGQPDIPFIFCWANETWTKRWDGGNEEVLIDQQYGTEEDWIKHYKYLLPFFQHPNYIKEDNCPILYVYRMEHIHNQNAMPMFTLWKKMAKDDGFNGLKIIAILGGHKNITEGLDEYIDGFAEHQPTYGPNKWSSGILLFTEEMQRNLDIQKFYEINLHTPKIGCNYTRGICYSWDHSSRRLGTWSRKFIKLSYSAFENYLVQQIINIAKEPNDGNNFILLNSWNEWSEQAMIEPNDHDGYRILEVIQKYFGA